MLISRPMSALMSEHPRMTFTQTKLKLVSLFVLAFFCLNAGGVLCLTYCGQAVKARAEYCPLKKTSSHCPHSQTSAETSDEDKAAAVGSVSCCTMPIGMIAPAPLEPKTRVEMPVAAIVAVKAAVTVPPLPGESRQISGYYYRPPPNDRRMERVRNQVFRI
jgi:hypothetical protein